ncbi:molybdate ABC transporter substrate-binding protein [Thalassobius sp. Cn5-15]|uniref:molybdate ABC transporter substrate-binding protein n=1 Tax=Thalassobius sp. Cn5-15 TaxID=2917763 RepID=UPI001EF26173|nr:molybdate ABC transporter substrate-binding protein [Thalassobius sp. Cn5-15]
MLKVIRNALAGLLALTASLASAEPQQITVFAAASLRDALSEVGDAWQRETGHTLRYSFAGSSTLARQVELGAPADLVILANAAWMDHLDAREAIEAESRLSLLSNRMVLIAPAGAETRDPEQDISQTIRQRMEDGRMAMALVDAVPAGIYGKAALQSLGLWDAVASKVAQTDNVRAALALVALGEAPLGIVYASDLLAEPRVQALHTFDPERHPAILYPAALVAGHDSPVTTELLAYLNSPIAKEIFLRHGFADPPQ